MSAQCRMRVMAVFLFTLKKAAMSFVVLKKQVLAGIILTDKQTLTTGKPTAEAGAYKSRVEFKTWTSISD